jgi:hypothetical protein
MSLIIVRDREKRKIIGMRNLRQVSFKTHKLLYIFSSRTLKISIWLTKKSENQVPFIEFCNVLCFIWSFYAKRRYRRLLLKCLSFLFCTFGRISRICSARTRTHTQRSVLHCFWWLAYELISNRNHSGPQNFSTPLCVFQHVRSTYNARYDDDRVQNLPISTERPF